MEIDILTYIINHFHSNILTNIMFVITTLGNHGAIWIAIDLILLSFKKTRAIGVAMAISMFLTFVSVNIVLKPLIDRARPFEVSQYLFERMLIALPSDGSFPSGHTAIAFSASTTLLCFNKKFGVPMIIFSVLMGLSRLYFAVHYPTDVIGGMFIGILSALIGVKIFLKYAKNA